MHTMRFRLPYNSVGDVLNNLGVSSLVVHRQHLHHHCPRGHRRQCPIFDLDKLQHALQTENLHSQVLVLLLGYKW